MIKTHSLEHVLTNAMMLSEDSVLEADHFKPVSLDSDSLFDFYAPCEDTEDEAIMMSYQDVPACRILVPEIKFAHLKQALSHHKSSVKDSDVNEIRNFSDNIVINMDFLKIKTNSCKHFQVSCIAFPLIMGMLGFLFFVKSLVE
jgi:hypothetical protein